MSDYGVSEPLFLATSRVEKELNFFLLIKLRYVCGVNTNYASVNLRVFNFLFQVTCQQLEANLYINKIRFF